MSAFEESIGLDSLRVQVGHAAVFPFPPLPSVPPPAVSWQSEDNTQLYGDKFAVTKDNALVVLSVDKDDEKRYR